MTSHEFYKAISNKTGIAQADIQVIIRAAVDVIYKTLCEDKSDRITFGELGYFRTKHAAARRTLSNIGNNKGKHFIVPAHEEIEFVPFRSHKWLPDEGYDLVDPVVIPEDEQEKTGE